MSETFRKIRELVDRDDVLVSEHGYNEMVADGISLRDIMDSLRRAVVVEDYPDYPKGPCVLVLQRDMKGQAFHVVWGIPKNASKPAIVVTAYRPDPDLWSQDFLRRKR